MALGDRNAVFVDRIEIERDLALRLLGTTLSSSRLLSAKEPSVLNPSLVGPKRLLPFSRQLRLRLKSISLILTERIFRFFPHSLLLRIGFTVLRPLTLRVRPVHQKVGIRTGMSALAKYSVLPGESGLEIHRNLSRKAFDFVFVYSSLSPSLWVPKVLALCEARRLTVLVAGSDSTFPRQVDRRRASYDHLETQFIEQLFSHPGVKAVFAENRDQLSANILPIPTGVLEDKNLWEPLYVVRFSDFPKRREQPQVLCAHHERPGKQFDKRRAVSALARNEWSSFTTYIGEPIPLHRYRKLLRGHRFTLCVSGGGLDPSPKAFEALLHGSIPIIERNATTEAYERLPVVVVDKWQADTLTEDFLDGEYRRIIEEGEFWQKVTERTSLRYWLRAIT